MNIEINKRLFWKYLNSRLSKKIHSYHVFAILSILLEELASDLKSNKIIKIFNFATISLEKTNPKKYYDVRFQKIMYSQGSKILKITLNKKVKKKLLEYFDIDKD